MELERLIIYSKLFLHQVLHVFHACVEAQVNEYWSGSTLHSLKGNKSPPIYAENVFNIFSKSLLTELLFRGVSYCKNWNQRATSFADM